MYFKYKSFACLFHVIFSPVCDLHLKFYSVIVSSAKQKPSALVYLNLLVFFLLALSNSYLRNTLSQVYRHILLFCCLKVLKLLISHLNF